MNPQRSTKHIDDYQVVRNLGQGAYGKVLLARHKKCEDLVALKILELENLTREERRSHFSMLQSEFEILRRIVHPNIIRFYELVELGVYSTPSKKSGVSYAVLEYCSKGELFDVLAMEGALQENTARHYFHQLMSGLTHLSEQKISHRDLKPENLLLDENLVLKIVDFGFATMTSPDVLNQTTLGSEGYMAPEFYVAPVRYKAEKVDVFASGVVLFNMMTGLPPFKSASPTDQLYDRFRAIPNDFWEFYEKRAKKILSPDFRELIHGMLEIDPEARYSFEKVIQSAWFNKPFQEIEAVKELESRISASQAPVEQRPEVTTPSVLLRGAPSRCLRKASSPSIKLRVDYCNEGVIGGINIVTDSIDIFMDKVIKQATKNELKIKFDRDKKQRILLSNEKVIAKVHITCAEENEDKICLRLALKKGNYQDFLEIKKVFDEAVRAIC